MCRNQGIARHNIARDSSFAHGRQIDDIEDGMRPEKNVCCYSHILNMTHSNICI